MTDPELIEKLIEQVARSTATVVAFARASAGGRTDGALDVLVVAALATSYGAVLTAMANDMGQPTADKRIAEMFTGGSMIGGRIIASKMDAAVGGKNIDYLLNLLSGLPEEVKAAVKTDYGVQ